ncbi:Na+/H+ antiporter subunit E [Geodermatophilus sp. SYSU D01045]
MTDRARHLLRQLPALVWLVLVWVLLWGTWSWANVLGGVLVAVLVTRVVPLPAVVENVRIRPLALLRFLAVFAVDLAVSSAQVAWRALRPGPPLRSAVIRVQLRTDSDLLLAVTSEALSLVPGSVVLDLDREHRVLAVHLLEVRDRDDLERQRAGVLAMEDRVVRAFGRSRERAALDAEPAEVAR